MKKIILLITMCVVALALQSCKVDNTITEYHLIYKVYYPGEAVIDTLVCYARGGNVPTYALRSYKDSNVLYVLGAADELTPQIINNRVLETDVPIRVISFNKVE